MNQTRIYKTETMCGFAHTAVVAYRMLGLFATFREYCFVKQLLAPFFNIQKGFHMYIGVGTIILIIILVMIFT